MTRKEAHARKDIRFSFYARQNATRWYQDYNVYQMTWLWEHNHIQWSKPMVELGENPNNKYIEFTERGKKWYNWYSCSLWQYIKYYILRTVWWKIKWQNLRIKMGHHYDWQDYVGLNYNEI